MARPPKKKPPYRIFRYGGEVWLILTTKKKEELSRR
jgi:hypothetical protein